MRIDKWRAPRTLPELQDALRDKKSTEYFISGGTDLLIAMKNGEAVSGLIDLTKLEALRRMKLTPQSLFIGGGLTYDEISRNSMVREHCPALAKAASMVGSQQVRNRGTVAGGVANASPASDIIPVLTCLGADVDLLDDSGVISRISISDFLVGAGKTRLQDNQCILGFQLPVNRWQRMAYMKLGSRSQVTIAQITVTMALALTDGEITECGLTVGSIGVRAVRLSNAQELFIGKKIADLTRDLFMKAADFFSEYINTNVPKEFDRDYKAIAVAGIFEDLFQEFQETEKRTLLF